MDYPYDVGSYSRPVTTASSAAQRWFDRGVNWCFGYHHEEAVRCFEKALEIDPSCAMAHWVSGTPPDQTTTTLGNCRTLPATPRRSVDPVSGAAPHRCYPCDISNFYD